MNLPRLDDLDLAYETGLHIGDGSLSVFSNHTYRYALSGNRTIESGFYKETIVPLLSSLYGLTASLPTYRNSIYAVIYSKDLVMFKARQLGLPIGSKDQLSGLPRSITERGKSQVAGLLSGLYDTDGSPKVRKTTSGRYPRISLAQKNKAIINEVDHLLSEQFGITSTLYRLEYVDKRFGITRLTWFLDINGSENVARYSAQIGSRHPIVNQKLRHLATLG